MSVTIRRFGGTIAAVGITLVLSALAYAGMTKLFTIQTIEIRGSGIQVVVDRQKLPKNLLFFPSDRIRKEIIENNPVLADVSMYKKFPHTLIIAPVLRTPVARLQTQDRMILVDTDAIVLAYGDMGLALPLIRMDVPSVKIGAPVPSDSLPNILRLIDTVSKISPIQSVVQQGDASYLFQTEKIGIFIAQDSQPDETIATLQTLIEGFRIKGTLPRVVDLRFDKPIVQF